MADESKDAQDQDQQDLDTSDDTKVDEDIKDSFLKGDDKDMQRMSSALGRALKDLGDLSKTVVGLTKGQQHAAEVLQNLNKPRQNQDMNPDLAKLNEKWQNEILAGNVVGVLDEYTNLLSTHQRNVTDSQQAELSRSLADFDEQPFFAEMKADVRKTAETYVRKGVAPSVAVELAYNKHKAEFLSGIVATVNKSNPASLEFMKGGGKKPPGDTDYSKKLPEDLEAAFQRDKKLFKDRKDYLAHMSPRVKTQYGIKG